VADLVVRGLATLGEPLELNTDPKSGFPVITLGRRITSEDVAAVLDESPFGGRVARSMRSQGSQEE
jgi:hypothetical protein